MLRQNNLNPCQLLQEVPEGSGNWQVVFDLARCNPRYIGTSSGTNDETKRCNVASLLTDITLPDGIEAILSARDNAPTALAFASTVFAIVAAIPGAPLVLFLGAAGATATGSAYSSIDTSTIRAQMDNAYWLEVKRQLFCSMPDDGILTPQALQAMADALNNIPNKEQANQILSDILRGMSDDAARYASAFGARYDGDSNGCDTCFPTCQLLGTTVQSQAISLGNNQWKLKVESGPYYVGSYRLPYTNRCCRITIDNVITAPSNFSSPVVRLVRCGQSDSEYFTELAAIDDQCFYAFDIYSTVPWEIDVTITDSCTDLATCQLYAEVIEGYFEALPAQPNGDFILNSQDRLPHLETGGYRRYFLPNASSCCQVEQIPFSEEVSGLLPAKVRVYDCNGNETEYTDPNDIAAFFAGQICFNSFALAPAEDPFYLVKVRLTACEDEWCHTFDFTTDDGDFSPVGVSGVYQTGTGWQYSDGPLTGGIASRLVYIRCALPASCTITHIEYTFQRVPGNMGTTPLDWWRINDNNGIIAHETATGSGGGSGAVTKQWNGSRTMTFFNIMARSSAQPTTTYSGSTIITSCTVRGQGPNPFGSNNC